MTALAILFCLTYERNKAKETENIVNFALKLDSVMGLFMEYLQPWCKYLFGNILGVESMQN